MAEFCKFSASREVKYKKEWPKFCWSYFGSFGVKKDKVLLQWFRPRLTSLTASAGGLEQQILCNAVYFVMF